MIQSRRQHRGLGLIVPLAVLILLATVGASAGPQITQVMRDFQGIRYTEVGRPVGMPMGGVGAGTIEITSQGTLAAFGNVNNWAARIPSIPGSGLSLTYTTGGKTRVFPLAGRKVRFEGNFPFAKLTFPDLPAGLTLWCWSPFVLHDIRHSAYPAALFDAQITNTGSEPADVGLVLAYGTDYGAWLQRLATANLQQLSVEIASSAAPWRGRSSAGISFSTKAQLDQAQVENAIGRVRKALEDSYIRYYDYTQIDIRPVCNRSYLHSPFGGDPGNAPLNFGDLKSGRQIVYGVPFDVIDDQANGGKSCIMVGGPSGAGRVDIPIGRKADCLFFFGNCAGWANAQNSSAEYVVRYADGSKQTVPLRNGFELSDWMGGAAAYSPAQHTGTNGAGNAYLINLFAVPTDGTKKIDAVEFGQSGGIAPILFAVTAGSLSPQPIAEGIIAMRRADIDRMTGSRDSLKLTANTDAGYTLAARHARGAQTLTYQAAGPDALAAAIAKGQSAAEPKASVYAVEQRFSLAAGKSATAGLVCSWYAPNHFDLAGHRFGHKYEDWFADSTAVAEEIARDHDQLLAATKRHYDLIATSALPKWYREMLASNFYLLPAVTWLTKDGIAFTYESADGCALFGTMDVRYYGSFTKLAAFPELDANVLRQFAAVQHPDGFIQHDLGGSNGLVDSYRFPPKEETIKEPSKNRHDYDGYWVNLPIKFCLEVARHYQWTDDRAFLNDMWPHIKRAITWIRAQDEDNDGLPETNYGYDGWRMVDKCNYDANQWIAMLVAVARLAEDVGEPAYARELREVHAKALAQVEKLLWTGSYFRQAVHNDTGNNDMVSIISLAGDWYADILGFDDGLPREQVRSALTKMDAVLGGDAVYGLTDCLFPDGSRNNSWISIGEAIGWQYPYASHCMYEGMDDKALRVADEVWRQFTVEKARLPWCQEEFIHDPRKGECPYWLLRDMRMGSTMVMSYAAAGLKLDIPAGTATIRPADWVWKDGKLALPILLPRWLGQVRCTRRHGAETYEITNIDKPLALKSLRLRTDLRGRLAVSIAGSKKRAAVPTDGMVDIGAVNLGAKPLVVRLAPVR